MPSDEDHEKKDDVYDCAQSVMEDGEDEDSAYAICQDEVGDDENKESAAKLAQAFQLGFEKAAQGYNQQSSGPVSTWDEALISNTPDWLHSEDSSLGSETLGDVYSQIEAGGDVLAGGEHKGLGLGDILS